MPETIHLIDKDLGLPETVVKAAKEGKVELWNAPRPFPAHHHYQGEFLGGAFYGTIYPDAPDAHAFRVEAQELGAKQIVFVSHEEVETWGRAYCEKLGIEYDDYPFATIAKSYLLFV